MTLLAAIDPAVSRLSGPLVVVENQQHVAAVERGPVNMRDRFGAARPGYGHIFRQETACGVASLLSLHCDDHWRLRPGSELGQTIERPRLGKCYNAPLARAAGAGAERDLRRPLAARPVRLTRFHAQYEAEQQTFGIAVRPPHDRPKADALLPSRGLFGVYQLDGSPVSA